jgi:hypothetical protein
VFSIEDFDSVIANIEGKIEEQKEEKMRKLA